MKIVWYSYNLPSLWKGSIYPVLRSRMRGTIPSLLHYAFMAWWSVKAQGQIYVYLGVKGNCLRRYHSCGYFSISLQVLHFPSVLPKENNSLHLCDMNYVPPPPPFPRFSWPVQFQIAHWCLYCFNNCLKGNFEQSSVGPWRGYSLLLQQHVWTGTVTKVKSVTLMTLVNCNRDVGTTRCYKFQRELWRVYSLLLQQHVPTRNMT